MSPSSKVMTRLTQLIQPIPAELRNGRINAWMAKRSGKVPQVLVKKHLVLSSLSGVGVRNKGGGQQAPRGAEEGEH